MSIFFDTSWFLKTMHARNLTKEELAGHLGMPLTLLQDIWEDVRIATPKQIGIIADLLGKDTHEVARRCGFPTAPPDRRTFPEEKSPEQTLEQTPEQRSSPEKQSPEEQAPEKQTPKQKHLEKRLCKIEQKLQDIHHLLLALIERR